MAKKKQEVVESIDDFTERLFADVEKEYGKNVLIDGESALNAPSQIIPWTPSLDLITTGGIEEGSTVSITGLEKTGKTTAALTFAANAQRPEYGSRPVYYAKVEGRLSRAHVRGIKGLQLQKPYFNIIQSVEGRILTAQDYLSILEDIINRVPGAVVIIDSISALCDERERNEGIGTETRGGGAKIFSQFIRIVNQVIPVNRTILIGITHLIHNTSGMGAKYNERAANMWKYQKDYDLRTIQKRAWVAANKNVGLIIKWVCNTSKNGPPGMTLEGYLRFGVGFDRLYELAELCCSAGLISKAGAWYTLSYLGREEYKYLIDGNDPPKFQGMENMYDALKAHPEWITPLEQELASLSSILVGIDNE